MTKKKIDSMSCSKNDSKKLKYIYILRISIAIRCNVSTQQIL